MYAYTIPENACSCLCVTCRTERCTMSRNIDIVNIIIILLLAKNHRENILARTIHNIMHYDPSTVFKCTLGYIAI